MAKPVKLRLNREILEAFLPNQRAIKEFEEFFRQLNDLLELTSVTSVGIDASALGFTTTPPTITDSGIFVLDGLLPISKGGNGTSNPTITGTGAVTVAGTWPNYTISATTGGLTFWAEAQNTAAPNATIFASSFTPVGTAANIDAVLRPKGTGAVQAAVADATAAGGNKRGLGAVDWQQSRIANTMVASGNYSTIMGGQNNSIGGGLASAVVGYTNTIGNAGGAFAAGQNNTIGNTGSGSMALGDTVTVTAQNGTAFGYTNLCDAQYATVMGAQCTTRGLVSNVVHGNGIFVQGRFQSSNYVARIGTGNATPTPMVTDNNAASAINTLVLPNTSVFAFRMLVTARDSAGNGAAFEVTGCIKRGASAATVALVGTPTTTIIAQDAAMVGTTVTAGVNTSFGSLVPLATGIAATTINWAAKVITAEVTA